MKINFKKINLMMDVLEEYPGVLPLHIFSDDIIFERWCNNKGYIKYMLNLKSKGLFDKLYWELYEEKLKCHKLSYEQLDNTIVEWVEKLKSQQHLLSDDERKWIKENPEYEDFIIYETEDGFE